MSERVLTRLFYFQLRGFKYDRMKLRHALFAIDPKYKKSKKYSADESDLDDDAIAEHEEQWKVRELEKAEKKFQKENDKLAEEDQTLRKPMMTMLDSWLRHKSEMVNFEAAKAICNMPDVTDAEAAQAIHVLQLFLTSPRAVTKFAAIFSALSMASDRHADDALRELRINAYATVCLMSFVRMPRACNAS